MSENRRRRNNGAQNTQVKKARTNNARRILLLVGLMSLVAVISIGGTIAWLTDKTDAVTNTFTTADINIDLTETWNADDPNDSDTQFDHWEAKLVPGTIYVKDPKVTVNAGSEACWLFVHVDAKNNNISFTNANNQTVTLNNVIDYSVLNGWKPVTWTANEETVAKDGYYYKEIDATTAKKGESYYVLTGGTDQYANGKVKINEGLTKEMEDYIKTNSKEPEIVITAAAVQSENVGTLAEAWAKLPTDFTN